MKEKTERKKHEVKKRKAGKLATEKCTLNTLSELIRVFFCRCLQNTKSYQAFSGFGLIFVLFILVALNLHRAKALGLLTKGEAAQLCTAFLNQAKRMQAQHSATTSEPV